VKNVKPVSVSMGPLRGGCLGRLLDFHLWRPHLRRPTTVTGSIGRVVIILCSTSKLAVTTASRSTA